MKTLESIMKSNAKKDDSSSFMYSPRKCDDCGVLEGSEDIERGYAVSLSVIHIKNKKKVVCQACKKLYLLNKEKSKKSVMERIKAYITILFGVFIIGIIISTESYAQPMLPTAPSQAPIDGGLGLLAAAGGAYAYKKLKASREVEE